MREGAQHRAANAIVAGKQAVVLETLDVPDMMEKEDGRLEGVIAAAAMRSMQRKVIYRCEAAGVDVIMAPSSFASSQICSGCGNRKSGKTRLQDEEIYECHHCGLIIDRDENAAINLKHYGEEKLGKRRVTPPRARRQRKKTWRRCLPLGRRLLKRQASTKPVIDAGMVASIMPASPWGSCGGVPFSLTLLYGYFMSHLQNSIRRRA